jgi:putative hydrolase of the HAD superfamily
MEGCAAKAVFFDFGGVVAEEGFMTWLADMAEARGLAPGAVVEAGVCAMWASGFVLGKGGEADFLREFRAATGISLTAGEVRHEVFRRFVIRPFMLACADRLRAAGIGAAILSDQTFWLDELDREHAFFRHFDMVFNSYHHGISKQDAAFFELAMDRMGVSPGQSIFIDDNSGNVSRAASLGIAAVHYTGRERFREDMARLCPVALEDN